jgi:hypothetical protein
VKIIILTKGNPFKEGSYRRLYWELICSCGTIRDFYDRFEFQHSATPASVLRWLVKDGHIRLEGVPVKIQPSAPLTTQEIRDMIKRLRSAQVAASVNDDPKWPILAKAITPLQELHKMKTGRQF